MSNTKQAFWALFGSLSAFVFSVISSMVLSRYFDKVDYGTYKQILYVYGSFLIVFTLGLPKTYSFFLPRLPIEEAKSAIKKINYILVASGLMMSLFIFFGADTIASLLNNKGLSKPLQYFSLVPIFLIPTIGLEGILSTYKKTQLLAFYSIITKCLMLILVVTPVVFFDGGIESAVIGFTLSSFLSFLLAEYLRYYPIRKVIPIKTKLRYKELFSYAFPLLFAGIWGVVIRTSDQFFISRYFGTEVFADFANGSLQLPFVGMIIGATSIVLAPIYSKIAYKETALAKQEIIRVWRSVFSKTIKLTYPLLAFFFIFSNSIMVILYGSEYITSGAFFQIKLIADFFTLITYGPLILSIGGNKFYYKVHMYGALILISLQALSIYFIDSAIAIVWVSVICHIGRILIMLSYISDYFEIKLIEIIPWTIIFKVLPSFLILYIIKLTVFKALASQELLYALITSGLVYSILFLIWSLICKLDYISVIKPLLRRG